MARPAVALSAPESKATPMMAQYLALKAAHPDELLFYRMGDFYELFFADAQAASKALDIALTRRGQHEGADVPMCGVPVHSHTGYVARLIRAGFRVAIAEQTETPEQAKARGSKALVERQVVRIITPGTLTEDSLLEARTHNYLAVLVPAASGDLALAVTDVSTGLLQCERIERSALAAALARLAPRELVLPESLATKPEISVSFEGTGIALTRLPPSRFDGENCRARLLDFFAVASAAGWGELSADELTAAGALIDYILLTQRGTPPLLAPPRRHQSSERLELDAATRRNLELTVTTSGERAGSLLATIDLTVTAAGARLLASRLCAPLLDVAAIGARQDSITFAIAQQAQLLSWRSTLQHTPDFERALARLALERGSPRDLAAIRDALLAARTLAASLAGLPVPPELASAAHSLSGHGGLIDLLSVALSQDLPLLARDGGFIAKGYDPRLDELRALRDESRRLLAALQARYGEQTGISSLKIKHNNIIGYHIEVSATQADKLFDAQWAGQFIHRQTMAGAVRFTTTELTALERELASAADRALAVELELFASLRSKVLAAQSALLACAQGLAVLDVSCALAQLAVQYNWCCPQLDTSLVLRASGARHPVVEAALRAKAQPFTANDCTLTPEQRLWLLTGPNMAGKSTFLRQTALLVILAQMGSYVPAASLQLGVVDRLYSRVGAADDLARGRSTFMVEMVETATILNLATARSLVILDEIGRGTATYDGLSIAWAVAEHVHDVLRCRALFATHYHELTALTARLPALYLACLKVKEWRGEVIFLHEVVAGAADRSYGLHVAKLAGLPAPVLRRAGELLKLLQDRGPDAPAALPLFAAAAQTSVAASPTPSALAQELAALQPDTLSPREALDCLYRLKKLQEQA